jgi:hypothetical protein
MPITHRHMREQLGVTRGHGFLRAGATAAPASQEQHRQEGEHGDVPFRTPTQVAPDDVRHHVRRRPAGADQRHRHGPHPREQHGEQQDGAQPDPEGADVLDEVLVVRLEPGQVLEERPGPTIAHSPKPAKEAAPAPAMARANRLLPAPSDPLLAAITDRSSR